MFGLTENQPAKPNSRKGTVKRISEGQLRAIAQAVSQMLAITVAESPESLIILLQKFNVQLSESPSSEEIINQVMDKIAQQDMAFNQALEKLIEEVMTELSTIEQYDNFGETKDPFGAATKLFGGGGSIGGFGGGISGGGSRSGSKFLDGLKGIGSSTAKGAAGGGIVGAALGAVGGIFGFASTAKQQKIEKEKASAMTMSSLLQYKTAMMNSVKGSGMGMQVGLALLAIAAVIFTIYMIKRPKKNQLTVTP